MPELPEMETYRALLAEKINSQQVTDVVVNREKSINNPKSEFITRVKNQKIKAVARRAKHLLIHLQSGDVLLLHLMLGGLMFYGTEEEKPDRTVQIQLSFGEHHLYFIGLRLGYLHLLSAAETEKTLADLGPEPLDEQFTLESFADLCQSKRGKLKTTLVDQAFLTGIGNRYADEIAWHAQLLPDRKMNELDEQMVHRLYDSIRYVLQRAIEHGGYMAQPLYDGDSLTGGYGDQMYVYDREGEPCSRCGTPITKEKKSSRKVFYCTKCQM